MSTRAKRNIGHKRQLTHTQKRKMAIRMVKPHEQYPDIFRSLRWRQRKWAIIQRVKMRQTRAHYHAEVRKGKRNQAKGAVIA